MCDIIIEKTVLSWSEPIKFIQNVVWIRFYFNRKEVCGIIPEC